jgi:hypothetical protein
VKQSTQSRGTSWFIGYGTSVRTYSHVYHIMCSIGCGAKIIPPTSKKRGQKALKYIKGEEKGRGEEEKEGYN